MFNMFVVIATLLPCKSYCYFFYLLNQNDHVYMTAELPCKQVAKTEEDLLDLYFCDLF